MGRPKLPGDAYERRKAKTKCTVCGVIYPKYNGCHHRKSKYHRTHVKLDQDVRIITLGDPKSYMEKEKLETVDDIIYDSAVRRLRKKIKTVEE